MRIPYWISILVIVFGTGPCTADALKSEQVNNATFADRGVPKDGAANPFVVKAQVLLGRRSISPGVIDGVDGENFHKAVAQFRRQESLSEGDDVDEETWARLAGDTSHDIMISYTLTEKDTE